MMFADLQDLSEGYGLEPVCTEQTRFTRSPADGAAIAAETGLRHSCGA